MADATFDGSALLITLPAAQTTVDVAANLYSAWKEWLKTGTNARFLAAFRTTGGDPPPGGLELGAIYFLRNDLGWRIKPDEADHEVILAGNLYPESGDLPMFVPTVGTYTVSIQVERSSLTQVVLTGSSVTEQDKLDIADRVLDEALSGHTAGGTAGKAITDIKTKTDGLPSGIPQGQALSNFTFVMLDSADHVTPKTGLTVSGQISKDGGNFASISGSISEVGNGAYCVTEFSAAEMNAAIITLRFTAAGADAQIVSLLTRP